MNTTPRMEERAAERMPGAMNVSTSARGRNAERPSEIPPKGWWDITWRVVKRIGTDNVTLVAGGVALYLLLSVFPGLAATVSLYGLIATPSDVVQHMRDF